MSWIPLGLAALSAAGNLVGAAAVTWRSRWSDRALEALLAVAAGFMVSVAVLELIPESVVRGGMPAGGVMLLGYLLVHLTQHTIAAHFHFGEERHPVSSSVSTSALVGLLLHTLVDGVAIVSGYQVSAAIGTLVFIAIALHKLPEGLAIASMFLAAGRSRRTALLAACALGVTTIVGVLLTEWIAPMRLYGLPLAAGVSLYVGASNLVPELQRTRRWRNALTFFAGCGVFVMLRAVLI
ncbi:MAG: ZIP family metal transporter [Gemmatimonadaceae bacterium]